MFSIFCSRVWDGRGKIRLSFPSRGGRGGVESTKTLQLALI